MNAFLFPGQGSQEPGMGKEIYETVPGARELLDKANETVGYDLKELMFNGPAETLTNTRYAQPAIYTCSAMYLEKARVLGIRYEYAAGHSLGEYTALYAAGIVSFEDGLRLVDQRGKIMAAQNGKGTMAAVLGLTEEELKEYLNEEVVMANLNSKTQIVISGTNEGVDKAEKALESRITAEEVKFRRLNVSAAFHSPQMTEAATAMEAEIQKVEMRTPTAYVVSNITGLPSKDLKEIKVNLVRQITGQVRWFDSIMNLKKLGIEQFYEIGNGEILRKLCKGITMRPKCSSI